MKGKTRLVFVVFVMIGWVGCAPGDDDGDTGNPWDGTDSGSSTGDGDAKYTCVAEGELDLDACGAYPAHEGNMWDLHAVVPKAEFKAYYDRNCDGEPELTTMRMYEDVYCQRDRIKSLVLAVGSNCGTAGNGT